MNILKTTLYIFAWSVAYFIAIHGLFEIKHSMFYSCVLGIITSILSDIHAELVKLNNKDE